MTAEQLAEVYESGWLDALEASMPEGLSPEARLLWAIDHLPTDNPHRDGPRPSRLVGDRAIVAHELAIAVDGGTDDAATWVGVVDALVESGTLREVSLGKRHSDTGCGCCWCCTSTPRAQRSGVHLLSCPPGDNS